MPVVAAYRLLRKRCAYAVVKVLRTGRAGGGAYETLLPLNRESRDQDLQSVISWSSYTVSSRFGGGQSVKVAQWRWMTGAKPLHRSGYNRCLLVSSAILMKAQQIASNPSQTKRFQPVKHGLEPVKRLHCAGYYGRGQLAGSLGRELHRRYTARARRHGGGLHRVCAYGHPHTGVVRPAVSVNRLKRFLSDFMRPLQKLLYRVLPPLGCPHTKERLNAVLRPLETPLRLFLYKPE